MPLIFFWIWICSRGLTILLPWFLALGLHRHHAYLVYFGVSLQEGGYDSPATSHHQLDGNFQRLLRDFLKVVKNFLGGRERWHTSEKSTGCSCRAPRFDSQYLHNGSQLPLTLVPEDLMPFFDTQHPTH